MRHRKSQNVHTQSCLHDEPGVTICCCWLDLEPVVLEPVTAALFGTSDPPKANQ